MESVLTKKMGMTQLYTSNGELLPVTLVFIQDPKLLARFKEGDTLIITGVSKGKGFQGAVKRHGFRGAPRSHGHKHDLRRVGSIGSSFPERVWKGRKMPGRMGGKTLTIKSLEVVKIDPEHKLIAIKGALPGAVGSVVKIRV